MDHLNHINKPALFFDPLPHAGDGLFTHEDKWLVDNTLGPERAWAVITIYARIVDDLGYKLLWAAAKNGNFRPWILFILAAQDRFSSGFHINFETDIDTLNPIRLMIILVVIR